MSAQYITANLTVARDVTPTAHATGRRPPAWPQQLLVHRLPRPHQLSTARVQRQYDSSHCPASKSLSAWIARHASTTASVGQRRQRASTATPFHCRSIHSAHTAFHIYVYPIPRLSSSRVNPAHSCPNCIHPHASIPHNPLNINHSVHVNQRRQHYRDYTLLPPRTSLHPSV
jgi:hypothetical protein